MHGPQGRVKQENGNDFKKAVTTGMRNQSLMLQGTWICSTLNACFSREIQQVMFETAGDVRKVRAGWPVFRVSEKTLSLAPELRVIAQY